jgi:dynein heavy chain
VSTNELYGVVHPQTREWSDGLMSNKMRELSAKPDTLPKWIVLDGDLDANWIESMNSVMDDNKILTLASNERIKLLPHMRLLFEFRNLKFATPATVSRAGILFISDASGYQWRAYFDSWLASSKYPAERTTELKALFEKYIPKSFDHIKKSFKYLIPVTEISMIVSLCKLLESFYLSIKTEIKNNEYMFVFCCVWCLGAGFGERRFFNGWWRDTWKTVKFPSGGSIFDYYVDFESNQLLEWKRMDTTDIAAKIDTSKRISSYTVPTSDTIALSYIMKQFLSVKHSPMLIGAAGCGKTQITKGLLEELTAGDRSDYLSQTINFNYYTDSSLLQTILESQLEKKSGNNFGPKGKFTLIYFIDDLNMPALDKYETQNAIALIRQFKDYNHCYERSKWTLKNVQKTLYVAAMNPTAGSFTINERLQRHFWLASVTFPETNSLTTIF